MHENDWPLGDLRPGTYTMTSSCDGPGDAVVTDDGRLLVQQHEGCWHDLASSYRPGISSWEFEKREPHATAQLVTTDHENILTPPLMLARYAGMASLLTTVWESRRKLQEQHAQLRRGARTLGSIVDRQCQYALDATGLHHLIDETGDGDWGAVWETVAELGGDLRAARKRIADLEAQLAGGAR